MILEIDIKVYENSLQSSAQESKLLFCDEAHFT